MIKLTKLIKEECSCDEDCCSTKLNENMEMGKVFTGGGFAFKNEEFDDVNENILKQIQQAEKIAKSMAGNMTGAVKGIEKIRRGLSRHKRVKIALKKANESVTEETINEAPEQQMASQLNKVSDTILKITDKFKGKADVDGMTRSWMMGLHARLKKAGIKI
jgi:uncharacterized Fe-S cluster-containing MiaB family protein